MLIPTVLALPQDHRVLMLLFDRTWPDRLAFPTRGHLGAVIPSPQA